MVTCPAYFGDRSFQEMKVLQMPLTRLNDSAFDAQLEGVYFGMWNGSTSVRCFVSHEALTDKAQGSGQAESLDVFHEYRSEIENLASAKYDAGKITSDGLVVVDSPDLTPEQFQQGLAWSTAWGQPGTPFSSHAVPLDTPEQTAERTSVRDLSAFSATSCGSCLPGGGWRSAISSPPFFLPARSSAFLSRGRT